MFTRTLTRKKYEQNKGKIISFINSGEIGFEIQEKNTNFNNFLAGQKVVLYATTNRAKNWLENQQF